MTCITIYFSYIMERILINAWRFFFHPFLTWNPTGAVKASQNNSRRNSFVWRFLWSFHERMGKCPCLVLVLQQVLLPVHSSFCFPPMKAENDTACCTDNIRVYDLKKFQRLIQVKLKAVSCYNITWIYSCSYYIGFGWYNTQISHSFVKN